MTAIRLHRYPSPSGGFALGKMGVGAKMMRQLPYDAEVKWLSFRSIGEYINTGLDYFPDFEIDIHVMDGNPICALRCDSSHCVQRNGASTPNWRVDAGEVLASQVPVHGRHVVSLRGGVFSVDGTQISTFTNRTWATGVRCYIPTTHSTYTFMLYGMKLWDANGTLVRNYIPVRIGSGANAVGHLYDRVSGELFGNTGAGTLAVGPDKVDVPYSSLCEWLGFNSGGEYIDTLLDYFPLVEADVEVPSGNSHITIQCADSSSGIIERNNSAAPYWRFAAAGYSFVSSVSVYGRHFVSWNKNGGFADTNKFTTQVNLNWSGSRCYVPPKNGSYTFKVFSMRLWDSNGNIVRDFMPARVGATGYLYDNVSGQLFGNSGTGNLIVGHDKT